MYFTKWVRNLSFVVLILVCSAYIFKHSTPKPECRTKRAKSRKHEMNKNGLCSVKHVARELKRFCSKNISFRPSPFPSYASAYRPTGLDGFRYSVLRNPRRFGTYNYDRFMKLANNVNGSMEPTYTLDLDVYRNDATKSGRASFKITQSEKRLFDLLTECVKAHKLDMDLRVVGGWVRDKLLDRENKDIDVAVPKMTGQEFCDILNKFTEERFGFSRTVGVVKRCPEQSKHLETATMNLLGFDVDFVNLRSEDYTTTSRIPVMRIGTPLEDALRRDFTVNSLFYNISRNYIEDFTGTGLDDLREGLIRTCSAPFETFMDDPLRAIRAVRFSSRLNFKLDGELVDALNERFLAALQTKVRAAHPQVSRSRIAQEIDIILSKGDVAMAFGLLNEFRILHVLLNVPTEGRQVDPVSGVSAEMLDEACALMDAFRAARFPGLNLKYLHLAALVAPTRELGAVGKLTVADYLIKDRLKLPNKYASSAHTISQGALEFAEFLRSPSDGRVALGMVIRSIGPLWRVGEDKSQDSLVMALAERSGAARKEADYAAFERVVAAAAELGIEEAYNIKAPITGQEVGARHAQLTAVLPRITSGPKFKAALEFQVRHMLADENVSKAELERLLKLHFKEVA